MHAPSGMFRLAYEVPALTIPKTWPHLSRAPYSRFAIDRMGPSPDPPRLELRVVDDDSPC